MKVGWLLVAIHPLTACEQTLQMAEAMAVDSIWLPDHLLGFFHPGLWKDNPIAEVLDDPDGFYDPYCIAAVLGQQTELPMGMCVTDGTRRRAADVARSALTLQQLCRGGFDIGVGSGEAESLLPFGYPFDKPVQLCEEFLSELRYLLDNGRMPTGPGRIGLPLESDAGRVRIWVGAHGPRMLRLTGQYADGWLPAWRMAPADYAASREIIAGHADTAERAMPECALFAPILVGESREHIAEMFERQPLAKLATLFTSGEQWQQYGLEHPAGADSRGMIDVIPHVLNAERLREIAPRIPMGLVDDYLYCGSALEIAEQLEPYARAGVEHFVFGSMLGALGGLVEVERHTPELFKLRRLVADF